MKNMKLTSNMINFFQVFIFVAFQFHCSTFFERYKPMKSFAAKWSNLGETKNVPQFFFKSVVFLLLKIQQRFHISLTHETKKNLHIKRYLTS